MWVEALVRYQVFFLIDLQTRCVEIAGITKDAQGAWMAQIPRNLTDCFDGFLLGKRFLILDRDPLYTRQFRTLLKGSGVSVVRLPARSPNLNAYAERFVLSVRRECLNRLIPLSENHLRWALGEFLTHYHKEHHHQGLGGLLIDPGPTEGATRGRVVCRSRLGGMLRHYSRQAA